MNPEGRPSPDAFSMASEWPYVLAVVLTVILIGGSLFSGGPEPRGPAPTAVDVTVRGKRLARGYKVWPVGISIAKSELYGWLRLERPTAESGAPCPPGFCHFPQLGEDYFKQLTAEHLVKIVKKRTRFVLMEWQVLPGRENHWLDTHVLARAAAALCGLDRFAAGRGAKPLPPPPPAPVPAAPPPEPEAVRAAPRAGGGWIRGRGSAIRGSWIRR